MAQQVFSAMSRTYEAVRKYRSVTFKDNFKLQESERCMLDALANFEAGTVSWKVRRRLQD